jgi:hypothetical protein
MLMMVAPVRHVRSSEVILTVRRRLEQQLVATGSEPQEHQGLPAVPVMAAAAAVAVPVMTAVIITKMAVAEAAVALVAAVVQVALAARLAAHRSVFSLIARPAQPWWIV